MNVTTGKTHQLYPNFIYNTKVTMFRDSINITTEGKLHLGAVIGSKAYKNESVRVSIHTLCLMTVFNYTYLVENNVLIVVSETYALNLDGCDI